MYRNNLLQMYYDLSTNASKYFFRGLINFVLWLFTEYIYQKVSIEINSVFVNI